MWYRTFVMITCSSLILLNIKNNTRDRRNIRKNENKMTFEHSFLGDDDSLIMVTWVV